MLWSQQDNSEIVSFSLKDLIKNIPIIPNKNKSVTTFLKCTIVTSAHSRIFQVKDYLQFILCAKSTNCVWRQRKFTSGKERTLHNTPKYTVKEILFLIYFWWLVRVTLVVDWWILPQNFGPVVGTYEGLLWLCEWTLGGDFTSRWWGHISRICDNWSFSATGGGGSKT